MRLARTVIVLVAFGALLAGGTGTAWASTTIDSVSGSVGADTNGEVSGASDCTQSLGFSDVHSIPSGSGPFFFSQSGNPASTPVSCSAGSGDNTSSASLTSVGSISSTDVLTLTQQGQGTTSANGNLVNPSGCVDFGGGAFTSTTVQFTLTQAINFTFSGSITTTQGQTASYSLTRTSPSFATIFDQTTDGLSPSTNGMLQPGTYQYQESVRVSNDVACGSGNLSDNFSYRLDLEVGGDHYQVEFKAWIAQPHVVDPYQPITLPTIIVDGLPLLVLRPRCDLFTFPSNLLTSTSFRGDGHGPFAGSYRAHMVIDFDWDGTQISNFTTSPNSTNFGTTTLDFHVTALTTSGVVSDDCTKTGMATQSAVGGIAFGGKGFLLQLDASDPLVSPQFAVPGLDGKVLGLFNTQNGVPVLTLQFTTDVFPSFGVEVTKDGVVQATSLLNDTSCMAPNSLLGPLAVPVLTFGLSSITQNSGQFTIQPSTTGATSARSSQLCSGSYDDLQLINNGNGTPFPAGDLGAGAARAPSILVAPASGGRFVPLTTALAQGMLAGVQHPDRTSLLVDPAHPVRIKVVGKGVVAQEFGLHNGHLGSGVSFGPVAGTLLLSAGSTVSASLGGHRLKPARPDTKPPVTRATVKVNGKFATLRLKAKDASGVARTVLIVAGKVIKLRHGVARIKASQLKTVRFYSIDILGNAEKPRRIRR